MNKEVLRKLSGCLLNEKVEHLLTTEVIDNIASPRYNSFIDNFAILVIEFNFY